MVKKVAILTTGGFAPCLSSAIGGLVQRYTKVAPEMEIIAHKYGYQGLLQGDCFVVDETVRAKTHLLYIFDGSPVGDSRVKLTNVKDPVKRGLIAEGADPLKVAADRLVADGVDVLRTIDGDDINTTAAGLAAFLATNGYPLTVVGPPKTIDNDVIPVHQSLGAWATAGQRAIFAKSIVAEYDSSSRMLIVHEVMGRHCGWLTAVTAAEYRKWLDTQEWLLGVDLSREAWDAHAVYVPEAVIDITAEAERPNKVMGEVGNTIIFLSEGTGLDSIVVEVEVADGEVPRNPFGHVKLNKANPGKQFGDKFAEKLGAEKVMIQKLGYFSRSAAANGADSALIKRCADLAVDCALAGRPGVIGQDEESNDELTAIAFERIKGGKPFDITLPWFTELAAAIGQPAPIAAAIH